jgi:hypothetical protein
LMPKRMFRKIFNFSHHKTLSRELRWRKEETRAKKMQICKKIYPQSPYSLSVPKNVVLKQKLRKILPRQLKTVWNWWDSLTNLHNNVMINCMLL